jgi:prepilin-type N-terminal cleavage/methylation domain-containing protein
MNAVLYTKPKLVNSGFSLIETLVAITLLVSVVSGVLGIASRSLRLTGIAREQLIAFYLAQEPIEYIRFVRDSNRLQNTPASWTTLLTSSSFLGECVSADWSVTCTIDGISTGFPPHVDTIQPCIGECDERPIKFSPSDGLYSYKTGGDWAASKYIRTTYIKHPADALDDEIAIRVVVSWSTGPFTRTVEAREDIFNW